MSLPPRTGGSKRSRRTILLYSALVAAAGFAGSLLFTGCGGSKKGDEQPPTETSTGSPAGNILDVMITPSPGSAFISSRSTFRVSWSESAPPPPSFTIALYRYSEDCSCSCTTTDSSVTCDSSGGNSGGSYIQSTDLTRVGDSYTWDLTRSGNDSLDEGGPYYVELASGEDTVQATYIVGFDRSVTRHTKVLTKTPVPAGKGVHTVFVTQHTTAKP